MSIPFLLSIGLFAILMAGITLYGYRRYARPGKILEQIGGPAGATAPGAVVQTYEAEDSSTVRVLKQIGSFIPVGAAEATSFGLVLSVAGVAWLGLGTNWLVAALSAATTASLRFSTNRSLITRVYASSNSSK